MTEPKKPTGEIGAIALGSSSDPVTFTPVEFPATKAEIERFVAAPFVFGGTQKGLFTFRVVGLKQNPTDDFDFTLETESGPRYLELMEIHLRDIGEETSTGQFTYAPFEAAERILSRISAKSARYKQATSHPIILLTYVTHWQFCLANNVYWLLALWLKQQPPVFESVYHLSFLEVDRIEISQIFPTKRDLTGVDPERLRDGRVFLLNPRGWQVERR